MRCHQIRHEVGTLWMSTSLFGKGWEALPPDDDDGAENLASIDVPPHEELECVPPDNDLE